MHLINEKSQLLEHYHLNNKKNLSQKLKGINNRALYRIFTINQTQCVFRRIYKFNFLINNHWYFT